MNVEVRPSELDRICIRGDVIKACLSLLMPVYGIKFIVERVFGSHVLVLDLTNDVMYLTTEGREPREWKSFTYPEQKDELLTELCNESKRRFESSTPAFNGWGS